MQRVVSQSEVRADEFVGIVGALRARSRLPRCRQDHRRIVNVEWSSPCRDVINRTIHRTSQLQVAVRRPISPPPPRTPRRLVEGEVWLHQSESTRLCRCRRLRTQGVGEGQRPTAGSNGAAGAWNSRATNSYPSSRQSQQHGAPATSRTGQASRDRPGDGAAGTARRKLEAVRARCTRDPLAGRGAWRRHACGCEVGLPGG